MEQIILNIVDKLMIILSFSFIAKILEETNLITVLLSKKKELKIKQLTLIWYFVGFILSGFFADMTIAAILFPIAIQFTKDMEPKDSEHLLLTLAFGICTGGDLTVFGANDNIIAIGLLQNAGINLSYVEWTNWLIVPTVIMSIFVSIYLYFTASNHKVKIHSQESLNVQNHGLIIIVIILLVSAFMIDSGTLFLLTACVSLQVIENKKKLLKLPYKALLLWTVTFIVGMMISNWLKTANLQIPKLSMLSLIVLLSMVTNITTNSSLTTFALPVVISMYPGSMLMIMCAIKAISTSYFTMYGNSCLAIANGYGIKQKTLLKHGLIVTFIAIVVQVFYFSLLQI